HGARQGVESQHCLLIRALVGFGRLGVAHRKSVDSRGGDAVFGMKDVRDRGDRGRVESSRKIRPYGFIRAQGSTNAVEEEASEAKIQLLVGGRLAADRVDRPPASHRAQRATGRAYERASGVELSDSLIEQEAGHSSSPAGDELRDRGSGNCRYLRK